MNKPRKNPEGVEPVATTATTRTALRAEQGMWEAFAEEERIKQEMAAMGKANDATPREADRAVPEPGDDAIERAAKAMYDWLASPDSDDAIANHFPRTFAYTWDALNEKYPSDGDTYRDMARAALQAAQKENSH